MHHSPCHSLPLMLSCVWCLFFVCRISNAKSRRTDGSTLEHRTILISSHKTRSSDEMRSICLAIHLHVRVSLGDGRHLELPVAPSSPGVRTDFGRVFWMDSSGRRSSRSRNSSVFDRSEDETHAMTDDGYSRSVLFGVRIGADWVT